MVAVVGIERIVAVIVILWMEEMLHYLVYLISEELQSIGNPRARFPPSTSAIVIVIVTVIVVTIIKVLVIERIKIIIIRRRTNKNMSWDGVKACPFLQANLESRGVAPKFETLRPRPSRLRIKSLGFRV